MNRDALGTLVEKGAGGGGWGIYMPSDGIGGGSSGGNGTPVGSTIATASVIIAGAALLDFSTDSLRREMIALHAYNRTATKAKEKEESIAIVTTKQSDNQVYFPDDPHEFMPMGLIPVFRSGTKNGSFISWMNPILGIEVFRWDENPNYSNGPHYHIYGKGHYYPGNIVPEPYASLYFPHN